MRRTFVSALLAASLGGFSDGAAAAEAGAGPPKKDDASHASAHGTADSTAAPAPGVIALPGGSGTLKFGGYVKVDYIQDFDAIGDAYEFKVNSIPVEGSAAADQSGRTTIHARESRINMDYRSGKGFRAFVEGDFFGDKNAFRLRHAYGQYGPLLGGQTWTTFMDITVRPLTVDFEGADGELFLRQALIRFTRPLSENWKGSIAVENPSPEFAVPGTESGSPRSNMPDIVVSARGAGAPGHLQVAAVLRQLRFDGEGASSDHSETGWGVNASLGAKTVGSDEVLGQVMVGEGAAHYVEGLSGTNSDGAFNASGSLTSLPVWSFLLGYTRHWSGTLRSGFAYSTAEVDTDPAQGGGALERIQDARVNLIRSYGPRLEVGGEVLWGRRDDQDGDHGEAWRGQFAIIYHIN